MHAQYWRVPQRPLPATAWPGRRIIAAARLRTAFIHACAALTGTGVLVLHDAAVSSGLSAAAYVRDGHELFYIYGEVCQFQY